jgi:hypothetical protein
MSNQGAPRVTERDAVVQKAAEEFRDLTLMGAEELLLDSRLQEPDSPWIDAEFKREALERAVEIEGADEESQPVVKGIILCHLAASGAQTGESKGWSPAKLRQAPAIHGGADFRELVKAPIVHPPGKGICWPTAVSAM